MILIFKPPCINYDLVCFPKERLSEVIECGGFGLVFFFMMNISRVCFFLLRKTLHLQQVFFLLYRKINTEKSWNKTNIFCLNLKRFRDLTTPALGWEMHHTLQKWLCLVINVNLHLAWFTVCYGIVTAFFLHAYKEAMCRKCGYMNKISINVNTAWFWVLMRQIALQILLRCFYNSKKRKMRP